MGFTQQRASTGSFGACDASEHELFFQRDVDFCGLLSKQRVSKSIFLQENIDASAPGQTAPKSVPSPVGFVKEKFP